LKNFKKHTLNLIDGDSSATKIPSHKEKMRISK